METTRVMITVPHHGALPWMTTIMMMNKIMILNILELQVNTLSGFDLISILHLFVTLTFYTLSDLHPVYESEAAPEALKETARQHPRAVPVVSEKHRVPNRVKHEDEQVNDKPVSPNMTMTEAVSEKLAPAYAAMSDTTHKIASKLAGLTIATPETQERAPFPTQNIAGQTAVSQFQGSEAKKTSANAGNLKQYGASSPQTWDKGVSVKEYFLNKLEPGEDERALSQAITEAISPRKTTGDTGVVEKVKEAVTSFFRQEEPSNASMAKAASLSSAVPTSSNITTSTQLNRIASTNAHSSKVLYSTGANSSPRIPLSSNAHEGNFAISLQ